MWRWCLSTTQEREAIANHRKIEKSLREDRERMRRQRIVNVMGMENSGATTLYRQIRMIHGEGYSEEDRRAFAKNIFQNIFTAIQALTNAMTTLNIPYANPENQLHAQSVQDVDTQQVTALEARHADAIRSLWADPGIRTCYSRRREFHLLDSAEYYMNNLDRIAAPGYVPIGRDMLQARTSSGEFHSCFFDMGELFIRIWESPFHQASRRIRSMLLEEDFLIVVASLIEYDQFLFPSDPSSEFNLMRMNSSTFNALLCNRWLRSIPVVLFLNKKDVLAEKIRTSHLQTYFPEFTGKRGDAKAAMNFILGLYLKDTGSRWLLPHVHFTCATDPEDIRQVFSDVKDKVLSRSPRNYRLE